MSDHPLTTLDRRYSDRAATPVDWARAREFLAGAGIYWLSTVRPDGAPHVTPLLAVWLDDALYICTGPEERKARNLAGNRRVALTTGTNAVDRGIDIVVEGDAESVHDEEILHRLAAAWVAKYGESWRFEVYDGAFHHPDGGGAALVFRVAPRVAFGFSKGTEFGNSGSGQTRWRFTG